MSERKLSQADAEVRYRETLLSIQHDEAAGKLKAGPDAHPFFKVSRVRDAGDPVDMADLARLLAVRLEVQGFTLRHSPELANSNLEKLAAERLRQINS